MKPDLKFVALLVLPAALGWARPVAEELAETLQHVKDDQVALATQNAALTTDRRKWAEEWTHVNGLEPHAQHDILLKRHDKVLQYEDVVKTHLAVVQDVEQLTAKAKLSDSQRAAELQKLIKRAAAAKVAATKLVREHEDMRAKHEALMKAATADQVPKNPDEK